VSTSAQAPNLFNAVLLTGFGGPRGLDDIGPFLANVLRGRRVPEARTEEVAHRYELFGGVSPITDLTLRQAAGLQQRLKRDGPISSCVCRNAELASLFVRSSPGDD
jgi:ferrochelatase